MRTGWLVPGLLLLVITGVLLYVPLPYPESHDVSSQYPLILYCPQVLPESTPSSSLCLSGSAPVVMSWSGGAANTWVEVVPCSTFSCSDVNKTITEGPRSPTTWGTVGYGGSGTFNMWVPTNLSLIVFTNSTDGVLISVTLNSMPEFHILWEVFAILGMVLCLVGILLPRHKRPKRRLARAPPPQAPEGGYFGGGTEPAPGEEPYGEPPAEWDENEGTGYAPDTSRDPNAPPPQ